MDEELDTGNSRQNLESYERAGALIRPGCRVFVECCARSSVSWLQARCLALHR